MLFDQQEQQPDKQKGEKRKLFWLLFSKGFQSEKGQAAE